MTSTPPHKFDEDEEESIIHNDIGKSTPKSPPSDHGEAADRLNSTTTHSSTYHHQSNSKNGHHSTNGHARRSKAGGACGRITKDTMFRVFLLLLILALLIPILVLVALTYQQGGAVGRSFDSSVGNSRLANGLQGEQSGKIAGEDAGVPTNAKSEKEYQQQMEEIYKKEPWRRDPTAAWKRLGSTLSESIDPRGDACSDFYGFSCDQWKDRNQLANDGRQEISQRSLNYDNVKAVILSTFDSMSNDNNNDGDSQWPSSVRWAKSFYDRCTQINDDELSARKRSILGFLSSVFPKSTEAGSTNNVRRAKRSPAIDDGPVENSTSSTVDVEDHRNEMSPMPDQALMNESITVIQQRETERPVVVVIVTTTESSIEVNETAVANPTNRANDTAPRVVAIPPPELQSNETEEILTTAAVLLLETNETNFSEDNTTKKATIIIETPSVHRAEPSITTTTERPSIPRDMWTLANVIRQTGASTFFDVDYSTSIPNPNNLRTVIRPPALSLASRRYYLDPYLSSKQLPALEKRIAQTLQRLKPTDGDSTSVLFDTESIRRVVQLEQAIARASPDARPTFDYDFQELQKNFPSSKVYTMENLESRWPRINWRNFLPIESMEGAKNRSSSTAQVSKRAVENSEPATNSSSPIDSDNRANQNSTLSSIASTDQPSTSSSSDGVSQFIITDPAYIDQLVGLLEDYPPTTVDDFLKWRYINSVAGFIDFSSNSAVNSDSSPDARANRTCYAELETNAPLVLAHILQKTNYGLSDEEKSKLLYTPESIRMIFNRTVKAFKSILEFNSQMNNSTKKSIGDDLNARSITIDWPDVIKDGTKLDSMYGFDSNADNSSTSSSFIDQLRSLRVKSKILDDQANVWSNAIPDVFLGTKYVGGDQLASVYDPRILDSQLSQSALGQFSTIGWEMARELVESVKNRLETSKFDQCLINQYNQYCYSPPINTCVDGSWTRRENFADNLGLQTAYKAYKSWESITAASGVTDAFPAYLAASNLGKFTLDQIFFLSYGNSFCNNRADEAIRESLAGEQETAPDEYRLRGSVENSNDFQSAFYCKAGDKIYKNPKERCQFS